MGEEHGGEPVSLAVGFSSGCSEADVRIAAPSLGWGLSQAQGVPRRDRKGRVVPMEEGERWIQDVWIKTDALFSSYLTPRCHLLEGIKPSGFQVILSCSLPSPPP